MRYNTKVKLKSQVQHLDRELINAIRQSLSEMLQTVRDGDEDSRGYLAQWIDAQIAKAYDNLSKFGLQELAADAQKTLRNENPALV